MVSGAAIMVRHTSPNPSSNLTRIVMRLLNHDGRMAQCRFYVVGVLIDRYNTRLSCPIPLTIIGVDKRQDERKAGATTIAHRTLHPQFSPMFLNDPMTDTQPQAGPFTDLLSREKRVEDPGLDLSGNARTGISDAQGDPVTGYDLSADHNSPETRRLHGIPGIGNQVQEYLFDLQRIDPDRRERGVQFLDDVDVLGFKLLPEEVQCVRHHPVQVCVLSLPLGLAREVAQVIDDGRHPGRLCLDPPQIVTDRLLPDPLVPEQLLGIASDDHQGLVQLVGHPRGQRPDRRELPGLDKLRLRVLERPRALLNRGFELARMASLRLLTLLSGDDIPFGR